jgi:ribose 5-phosphate isomerase B
MGMRIAMGSDHAGYALKVFLKPIIEGWGHEVTDLGAYEGETGTDYPDYGRAVGQAVACGEYDCGILVCRAALCHETYTARMARSHNDANVLCMGGRVLGAGVATDVVRVFLETAFSGVDRHQRRVEKIHAIERDARQEGR